MLDLAKVSQQIHEMGEERTLLTEETDNKIKRAIEELNSSTENTSELASKLDRSKTSWLVAEIVEPLDTTYPLPELPAKYSVVSTDGSQIVPSHHEVTPAFLINIGSVALHYGTGERTELTSTPSLFYKEEDLYLKHGGLTKSVAGEFLGTKRTVMEYQELANLIEKSNRSGHITCALADGTLIMWTLESQPEDFREKILDDYLTTLEKARQYYVPIAGYLSKPRSRDVVNALRVRMCPEETSICDNCPYTHLGELPCQPIEGVTDRALFKRILTKGKRTAIFGSSSKILSRYEHHRICFFYMNVDSEICRVEIPRWVADDKRLLDLVQSAIMDQVEKGMGYPIALSEAHQLAVVRGAERELFYEMITDILVKRGVGTFVSPKHMRKRKIGV